MKKGKRQSVLGFHGGVGSVTGANFLLDTGATAILIDCGLEQGVADTAAHNARPFPYQPADIDTLLVTHAHTDHIGRIPKLVQDGFVGTIYSTPPTKALSEIMLRDAHNIMVYEHERYQTPLWYDVEAIDQALNQWQTFGYEEWRTLADEVEVQFINAGHILGSAMVLLRRDGRVLVCTGDVGNVPQPLSAPPQMPEIAHYLITESVYGDRTHEAVAERAALLRHHLEAVRQRGGTLIIPAFSLERTQTMLYEINHFVESGEMEPIPVFLDSPLAIAVTDVYRRYASYLSPEAQARLQSDDDLFSFPGFRATRTVNASHEIDAVTGPKVIIAGSGMSHGGRIRRHEQHYLSDPTTTVLLVGHQVAGSLGRRLQEGVPNVTIDGVAVKVKATIATISGYSGHADREQLLGVIDSCRSSLERVFVTMGEENASLFLAQRIHDYLGLAATVPAEGEEVIISF